MGRGGSRFGAGRPGWHVKAEHCLKLDVRTLARRKLLGGASFSWSWSNTVTGEKLGSIGLTTRPGGALLHFSSGGTPVSQDICIINTPCHFGGLRPWFQCPRCWRRVGVLFLRSSNFMCRHCGRVAYASQSEDDMGRAWIKQHKLERRLDEDWQRPRGMHRATYERIIDKIMSCEEARDAAMCVLLGRLLRASPRFGQ
jgi:hypothetical protein